MSNRILDILSLLSANEVDNIDEAYERHTIRELLEKEYLRLNYDTKQAQTQAFIDYKNRLHLLNNAK